MLQLTDLTRRFGSLTAVDGVTFGVPDGQLTGFVGANGAGKTTAMRMVMGVLAIHAGSVSWNGAPLTAEHRRRFGYMPEERGLYPKARVIDQLVYLAQLHGMDAGAARRAGLDLLERFDLAERSRDKVERLSLGNQQRVQIIAALMAEPIALVLDEPFSGLDPIAVESMAEVLREHTSRGVPVLFSSHQLDLVERLCDRLVVLARGRMVAEGTVEQLRSGGPLRYRLALSNDAGWVRDWGAGIRAVDVDGSSALVEVLTPGAEQALLVEAVSRGSLREFARVVPPLSDIYREVTA